MDPVKYSQQQLAQLNITYNATANVTIAKDAEVQANKTVNT
jgi:hypothetical protein